MSTKKRKIPKLTEKQYNEYVATLRGDASLYSADGAITLPKALKSKPKDQPLGD